jgi:hypothetical protein
MLYTVPKFPLSLPEIVIFVLSFVLDNFSVDILSSNHQTLGNARTIVGYC